MSQRIEPWMRIEYTLVSGSMYWVAFLPDRSGGFVIDDEDEARSVLAARGPSYHHWMWE